MLVDCLLYRFRKIPFTCAYLPGKSQVHLVFWFGVIPLVVMIHKCGRAELDAIQSAAGCSMVIAAFAAMAFAIRRLGDSFANRRELNSKIRRPAR